MPSKKFQKVIQSQAIAVSLEKKICELNFFFESWNFQILSFLSCPIYYLHLLTFAKNIVFSSNVRLKISHSCCLYISQSYANQPIIKQKMLSAFDSLKGNGSFPSLILDMVDPLLHQRSSVLLKQNEELFIQLLHISSSGVKRSEQIKSLILHYIILYQSEIQVLRSVLSQSLKSACSMRRTPN